MLVESGVYMGSKLNSSYDKIPPDYLYKAVQHMSPFVSYHGNGRWSFEYIINNEPDEYFVELVNKYLEDIIPHQEPKGWKLPETTLIYPWILKMFPDAYYIFWWRHPKDAIFRRHKSDSYDYWGIGNDGKNVGQKRALSWKYQYDLIHCIPKPKNSFNILYEDFCMDPESIVKELENFLGMELVIPKVYKSSMYIWKTKNTNDIYFNIFDAAMEILGYE